MKKKNEDEKNKDFFYYDWKITALQSGSILPIFCPFWGTLKDHSFLTIIGIKNLMTYLESAKFEVFIS